MNNLGRRSRDPWNSLGERLLAATAIKIELPPSHHRLMAERKEAIEKHLERDGSLLQGRIRIFYQQGSVAIGATIKAKFRGEGFDIDIVVELSDTDIEPDEALDLLFQAMRGDKGSRYYDCTERQTRCVTVHYADGMHIDLSPSVLIDEFDPRRSHIFHSKPEEPRWRDKRILTNSYAFAERYNERCPVDQTFAEEYGRRARLNDAGYTILAKDADSEPVPDHSTSVGGKSAVTVALQLLKRNRNIRWRKRPGRMPASVMLSCLALECAEPGRTIGQNLRVISEYILERLEQAQRHGQLIHVENPECRGDTFTDRWPENSEDQRLYIADMKIFLSQLDTLLDERCSLKTRTETLQQMFGEKVGKSVLDDFAREIGDMTQRGAHRFATTGSILAAPSVANAKPTAPRNTFYGSKWPRK